MNPGAKTDLRIGVLRGLLFCLFLAALQVGSPAARVAAQAEEPAPAPQIWTSPQEITAIQTAFGIEYPVPRGPRHLVEEGPGALWYTAPNADGVGRLNVTSAPGDEAIRYTTRFIGLVEGSEPYNLVHTGGYLWVTLRGGNGLAQITTNLQPVSSTVMLPVTQTVKIHPLPVPNSRPTGIAVGDGGVLWIAAGNGRIFSFDTATESFTEYPLPEEFPDATRIEEILYQNERVIWFTMPDGDAVATYNSVTGRFFQVPTGAGTAPTGIILDANQRPWVTFSGTSRIARFSPTTVTTWLPFDTSNPDSRPVDLVILDEHGIQQVWFTEINTGSASRLELFNLSVANRDTAYLADPPGAPWGIILSQDKHIWIADTERNVLYELTPPYLHKLYLAGVYKNP